MSSNYYYHNEFFAYELNGSNVTGWPKMIPSDDTSDLFIDYYSPVLTDLDEDDDLDIILGREHHLMVWDL